MLHVSVAHYLLLLSSNLLYGYATISQFIHLLIYFQFLATIDKTTMEIIHTFLHRNLFSFLFSR